MRQCIDRKSINEEIIEQVRELYVVQNLSRNQVADKLEMTEPIIKYILSKYSIKKGTHATGMVQRQWTEAEIENVMSMYRKNFKLRSIAQRHETTESVIKGVVRRYIDKHKKDKASES